MSLEKTIARLKKLRDTKVAPGNQSEAINEILLANRDFLEKLLQLQLAEGKDMFDEPVMLFDSTEYAPRTIANKLKRGSGTGAIISHVTNYMKGAFYSSIRAEVYATKFVFSSDIYYYDMIILRSGARIMHLNKRYMQVLMDDIIKPQLRLRGL